MYFIVFQGFQQTDTQHAERSSDSNSPFETGPMESLDAALLGKPKRYLWVDIVLPLYTLQLCFYLMTNLCCYRLDQPKKVTSNVSQEDMHPVKSEGYGNASEIENFLAKSPIKVD